MRKLFAVGMVIAGLASGGCTAVKVQPIGAEHRVDHICIRNNPRVQVDDFVQVMQEGFTRHGVTSQVISGDTALGCAYTASYTARRSWDFATYLSQAQIDVQRDGRQIATAHYHLRNKGGLALNKWAGTRSKILPVIDELLAKLKAGGGSAVVAVVPSEASAVQVANADAPAQGELATRLANLKDAYDAALVSREEYDARRKELIDAL